jgi:hypothetical protein
MAYPTSAEIRTGLQAIRDEPANAPFCTIGTLESTHLGTPWSYMKISKSAVAARPKFLVTGGVHGNEWVPPAAILNFTKKLLDAYHASVGITMNTLNVSVEDIKSIVDKIDIYIAPIVNPDGYDHSLATLSPGPVPYWEFTGRKNRRVTPPACPAGVYSHDGVNINRNFDIVWDYRIKYAPNVGIESSDDWCDLNFIGPTVAFSEPETCNVRALLDEGIRFFIDCHMAGPDIFYSWGIETNQDVREGDPIITTMAFWNPVHDVGGIPGPTRDGTLGAAYKEYIDQNDLKRVRSIAWGMKHAIFRGTGVTYNDPQPGARAVAMSGAADDYAYSRHSDPAIPGRPKILAFTLECGNYTSPRRFQPDFTAASGFPAIEKEVHCAVLHYLVHVSRTT